MIKIFLKFPAESVLRFRYVSKSWCSIINSQQFIEAFMSLSLTRSRLLLAFSDCNGGGILLFSSPHQNSSFLSSLSIILNPHINKVCNSVRGLVCCRLVCCSSWFVVWNPTTGQVIPLFEKKRTTNDYSSWCHMFLGYDPNNNQYKVLRLIFRLSFSVTRVEHSVCTLGGQRSSLSWRPIKTNSVCTLGVQRLSNRCYNGCVCLDGVVYYQYQNHHETVVSSFDVGSEQLRLIETPEDLTGDLTEYIGKLAVHRSIYDGFILWVLEDVKNQVWSKRIHIFQSFASSSMLSKSVFMGITASGEIVYAPYKVSDSCELLCYDLEKKVQRRFRFEGLPKNDRILHPNLCSYVDNIVYL